jgi:hypothetical protein
MPNLVNTMSSALCGLFDKSRERSTGLARARTLSLATGTGPFWFGPIALLDHVSQSILPKHNRVSVHVPPKDTCFEKKDVVHRRVVPRGYQRRRLAVRRRVVERFCIGLVLRCRC